MHKRRRSGSQASARKRPISTTSSETSSRSSYNSPSDTEADLMPPSSTGSSGTGSIDSPMTDSGADTAEDSNEGPLSPAHQSRQSESQVSASRGSLEDRPPAIIICAEMTDTGLATPLTVREMSHDAITIPAAITNSFQHPTTVTLTAYHPAENYPVFHTGNAFIYCNLVDPPRRWQLHGAILERHSPWFRKAMHLSSENSAFFHAWHFFLLEERDGDVSLVLQRARPVRESANYKDTLNALGVKIETAEDAVGHTANPTPPESVDAASTSSRSKDHTDIVDQYDQVLGSFYNIPLRIPSGSITATLSYCESLLQIAQDLGCTQLISAQVSTALQSHRQALYIAIKSDPARWLLLSIALENSAIYTESLIHIVGAHPSWPWPTKRCTLPDEIMQLVKRKSADLDQMCTEAERDLLLLTITYPTGPVQPHENAMFDTWFVVQTFRDQLAREFHELDNSRSPSLKRGTVFRKIHAGGSSYMPYEEMRRLMVRVMPSAVENLEEDLAMLKEHAEEIVEGVAKNELVLGVGVGVGVEEVGYLTCVKVGREDMPWCATGGGES